MKTETVHLPELGAHVTLREASVGDILPLAAAAGDMSTSDLMIAVLAVSLYVGEGQEAKPVTAERLQKLPARCFRMLMKLGPRALAMNGFIDPNDEETEEAKVGETAAPKI